MQPILVSYEAPFRSNLQKKIAGPVGVMAFTGPVGLKINIFLVTLPSPCKWKSVTVFSVILYFLNASFISINY